MGKCLSAEAVAQYRHDGFYFPLPVMSAAEARVYRDKLSGTSTREQRPGLAALLDYARPGDAIVVVGIDRLAATPPRS